MHRPKRAAAQPRGRVPRSGHQARRAKARIWHESYLIADGSYECVYNNMPPIGLGAATGLVPAAGRKATAAGRAGIREEPYPEGAPADGIEV